MSRHLKSKKLPEVFFYCGFSTSGKGGTYVVHSPLYREHVEVGVQSDCETRQHAVVFESEGPEVL